VWAHHHHHWQLDRIVYLVAYNFIYTLEIYTALSFHINYKSLETHLHTLGKRFTSANNYSRQLMTFAYQTEKDGES